MKVICISAKWKTWPGFDDTLSNPEVGDILTVRRTIEDKDGVWYTFLEYDERDAFWSKSFALLNTNINEEKLICAELLNNQPCK